MSADPTQGHSPTPWEIIPQAQGGSIIAKPFETGNQMNPRGLRLVCQVLSRRSSLAEDDANAALIVRAVNSHAALVAALKRAREFCDLCDTRPLRTLEMIDAALALANGGVQ